MFRYIYLTLLLLASPLAFADALDISLNNDAVAFKYDTSAGGVIQGNTDVFVGMLYNGTSMNTLAEAGMLVKGDESDSGAILGVGAKVIAGTIKNFTPGTTLNVASIVIGGEIGYVFPAVKQLSVAFFYFGGPTITTFGDANRAGQWGLHADYEVSQGAKIYVEYTETNFGISATGQTATLDSGTYVGVKLSF